MRRAELLGLRWQDVDLDTRQLRVCTNLVQADGRRQLTPTKSGRGRVISIDDDTAATIARQPRPALDDWPLVFTTPDGMPWHPGTISGRWSSQWPGLELTRIRLHDLRHTHATLLFRPPVPIKVVAERLGHASITTTMDITRPARPGPQRRHRHQASAERERPSIVMITSGGDDHVGTPTCDGASCCP